MSQVEMVFSYYKARPMRDIPSAEVVDWATAEWEKRTGKKLRDPDRAIRTLYDKGRLIKIKKGLYRYDPDAATGRDLPPFTAKQRTAIFRRDRYKCCVCGRGKREGMELHADHIKPRAKGGKSEVANGQTLCSEHNFRKKTLGYTEAGKKMFVGYFRLAKKTKDERVMELCRRVLEVYEYLQINGHIPWNEKPPRKRKRK